MLCSRRELTIKDVNNLMIIAHKEDGLIWGGNNLNKDHYLVVCIIKLWWRNRFLWGKKYTREGFKQVFVFKGLG